MSPEELLPSLWYVISVSGAYQVEAFFFAMIVLNPMRINAMINNNMGKIILEVCNLFFKKYTSLHMMDGRRTSAIPEGVAALVWLMFR